MHLESTSNITPAEMVARAASLAKSLEADAARIEQEGRIPDGVAQRLVAGGFFKITQPTAHGGYGFSPRVLWEVVLRIASGCPSTAWVLSLVGANILMLGRFSSAAQSAVFDGQRPPIVSLLTGGVGEGVQVSRVPGGYRLSGKWRYASGIDIATWVGLLVNVPGEGASPAAQCVLLVPQSSFAIDHASWNVIGMRGTGSKCVTLQDVFVPEDFAADWNAMQSGVRPANGAFEHSLTAFPLNTLFAMSVLAPTLGVASAIAEEATRLLAKRVLAGTQERQIDDKKSQIDIATATATMDLLCTNLLADTDRVAHAVLAGEEVDVPARALMRMKIAVSSRLALQTAQALVAELGGSILPQGTRIERAFRDVHAMSSHFLLQPAHIGTAFGRLALGLPLPAGARV